MLSCPNPSGGKSGRKMSEQSRKIGLKCIEASGANTFIFDVFFCILTFRLCMVYLSQAGGHCTSKSDITGWRRYSKLGLKPLLSLFLWSAADILQPSSNQALATFSLLLRTSSELSLQGGQHFRKQCNFPDVPSVEPNLKKQYFCEEFSFYGQVWGWSSHGTSLMDWDAVSDFNFKRGTKSN